jgi:hypothetical protein
VRNIASAALSKFKCDNCGRARNGRRRRLKIDCHPQGCAGSTPAARINESIAMVRLFVTCALLAALMTAAEARRVPKDDGPDLPYACWRVRLARSLFTEDQLESLAKENRIVLSEKQRRQAAECLKDVKR